MGPGDPDCVARILHGSQDPTLQEGTPKKSLQTEDDLEAVWQSDGRLKGCVGSAEGRLSPNTRKDLLAVPSSPPAYGAEALSYTASRQRDRTMTPKCDRSRGTWTDSCWPWPSEIETLFS